MKKKLIAGAIAGAALAASVLPIFAAKLPKVEICHIIEANDTIPFGFGPVPTVLLHFGKEISVSENAVDTHVGHGDSTTFFGGVAAAGPIAAFKAAGAMLPAADCYLVGPLP